MRSKTKFHKIYMLYFHRKRREKKTTTQQKGVGMKNKNMYKDLTKLMRIRVNKR